MFIDIFINIIILNIEEKNMDVQSLLDRISFLEEEVHRCYAEIEDYEVKIQEYEDALNEFLSCLKKSKVK